MAKVGKCIACGAHRIVKQDMCKRCRNNGNGKEWARDGSGFVKTYL